MASKNSKSEQNDKDVADLQQENSARDTEDKELVTAALGELNKLKRQLRKCVTDLAAWRRNHKRKITLQRKEIQLLEKEKFDCQTRLINIKQSQKPPQSVYYLIDRYRHVNHRWHETRIELLAAKEELKNVEKKYKSIRSAKSEDSGIVDDGRPTQIEDKLDHVITKYNRILAKNMEMRCYLQEMMRHKTDFLKNLKILQDKRSQIRLVVDRLYEEATLAFQEREECRVKLQLLRQRLEWTRTQGQKEVSEYRRLLNNDEKLNNFLEKKNQVRLNLDDSSRSNLQQNNEDEVITRMIEEWRETIKIELGHTNFEEIIQQYMNELEQGYVLYGLIAQKNNEIENMEKEMNQLSQLYDQFRLSSSSKMVALKSEPSSPKKTMKSLLRGRSISYPQLKSEADKAAEVPQVDVPAILEGFQRVFAIVDLQLNLNNVPKGN